MRHAIAIALFVSSFAFVGCRSGDLRGSSKASPDGKTYLVVAHDNGGRCPLKLDGTAWPHAKGQAGRVESGHHTLSSCDAAFGIDIAEGVVYTFDYWGP
jgi:hypothetical protein